MSLYIQHFIPSMLIVVVSIVIAFFLIVYMLILAEKCLHFLPILFDYIDFCTFVENYSSTSQKSGLFDYYLWKHRKNIFIF